MKKLIINITSFLILIILFNSCNKIDDYYLDPDATTEGDMQWNRTYGGARSDGAHAVIQTADGEFAFAGYTMCYGAGDEDFWLVKTDACGNMQWNRTYGDSDSDVAHAMIQTMDGGFVLAGRTQSFEVDEDNISDAWLVKTDTDGNMEWSQTYGSSEEDTASTVIQTADGGFALAGDIEYFSRDSSDVWLVKTDAQGEVEWQQTYGASDYDKISTVIQTTDGGFALAGRTKSYGVGHYDAWLVKTDAQGEVEWQQTYGGSDYDCANAVIATGDGGFALAGFTYSYGAGRYDAWLVKTDAQGEVEWQQTYGGSEGDWASAVIEGADGGFVLGGSTESFGAGEADAWLVKIESADTDGDGLANVAEVDQYGTNPTVVDTDGDGLGDGTEVLTYETNPLVADTNGDTYSDGAEVSAGTNPLDPAEHPSTTPGTIMDIATTDTPAAFIPGFILAELGLALACLVVLARRKQKTKQ